MNLIDASAALLRFVIVVKRFAVGEQMTPEQFRQLPKAEVHVHLEGSVEVDVACDMASKANIPLPRPRERLLEFENPAAFFGYLDWVGGLVTTPSQLEQIAYRFSQRLSGEGIRYADVIVNPVHWSHWRRSIRELISGLDRGFTEAELDGLPSVGLCMSLARKQSSEEAIEFISLLTDLRHPRVVAVSLDGDESAAGRSSPRFAGAFRQAAAAGLRKTAHAGASSVPESLWDAIEYLDVDRIDHGYRAIQDGQMLALLADERVPLGLCPTSNLRLGQVPSIEAHPIETLRRAGVLVSVNTDDPAMFGITLPEEYAMCAAAFDWTDETIRRVAETSIRASFANDDLKASMLRDLEAFST